MLAIVLITALQSTSAEIAAQRQPRSQVRHDSGANQWQRLDTGVFQSQMDAAVAIPPQQLRTISEVWRNGDLRLEVPFASIRTSASTLILSLSIDAEPGLACTSRGCTGTIQIGLLDTNRPLEQISLATPLAIQLYGVDKIDPSQLQILATRVMHPVRVTSHTQTATLKILPVGLASIEVPLSVRTLKLNMSVASRSIEAFGLEKTELNIAPIHGLDLTDTVMIRLEGSGLRAKPSTVAITALSGASLELRSRRIGTGRIVARGPEYIDDAEESLEMTMPWPFLLFSLAGGLIGALAFEKWQEAKGHRAASAVRVIAFALMGTVMAVAAALGINTILELSLPTGQVSEFLAFATSGIGAASIDGLLERKRKLTEEVATA